MSRFIALHRRGCRLAAVCAAPLIALAALAAPALAEPQIRLAPPSTSTPPRLDLSRLASPYDAGQALKAAGIAHTAIDRSLQGQAATASLGFLCGMQPTTETSGAAGAFGVDNEGRFLGAQLRVGFH